jgi:hypothetical protein
LSKSPFSFFFFAQRVLPRQQARAHDRLIRCWRPNHRRAADCLQAEVAWLHHPGREQGGAGCNLGSKPALREPADGFTLLAFNGSYAANAVVTKPAHDSIAAIKPIVQFTAQPSVLMIGPNY